MKRRTFLKAMGIGAVGAGLGLADYDALLGEAQDISQGDGHRRGRCGARAGGL